MIVVDLAPVYHKESDVWRIGTKKISNETIKCFRGSIEELIEILYCEGWDQYEAAAAGILFRDSKL
jgi:hypothetical protein